MGDNIKKNMLGALAWTTVNIGGIQLIQLIIGIILARVLLPEDFGLVGVLYIFIGLSTVLIDSGFSQGLIRKQDASNKDFSTIFYLNLILSVFIYLILFFTAPYIALFFGHQELTLLSRIIFLSVLLFPFYLIQQVNVLKRMDYRSMAIVNIVSVGLSGVLAIVLAFNGFGAWSLVWQQVTFHFFKVIFFPFFVKWIPDKRFSMDTIREMWRFSAPLLGQSTLNVVFNHVYMIIIGKFYPLKQAGFFAQANKYSETVNAATQSILNYTAFPIFSTIQQDKERSLRIYRKLTSSIAFITFPLVCFLFVAAKPVIITLISEKWIESVVLFQLLIIANLFTPMFTINVNVLNAGGESGNTFRLEIIRKVLITISIIIAFSFGIKMMLSGFIVANFISFAISMLFIKKSLNHYYKHQLTDILKILLLVIAVTAITYPLNFINTNYVLKLIVFLVSYFALYLSGLYFFFNDIFKESFNYLMRLLKKMK